MKLIYKIHVASCSRLHTTNLWSFTLPIKFNSVQSCIENQVTGVEMLGKPALSQSML